MIREETAADAAAVAAVITAAFADHAGVADLWAGLGRHRHVGLVATGDEGAVVGHVGLSRAWVDARERLVEAWLLSPLSVLPEHQGEGIGTALVSAAVATARAAGAPALFLEGSPAYYGPRGFERASAHGFAPASVRTPDAAFQVVLLDGDDPALRGRLVYPSTWWEHDAAGLRDPDLAELEARLGRSS